MLLVNALPPWAMSCSCVPYFLDVLRIMSARVVPPFMRLAIWKYLKKSRPVVDKKYWPQDDDTHFCSKRCFNIFKKELDEKDKKGTRRNRVTWASDGSNDILISWLTTEGNYAKYVGGDGNSGETKTRFNKEIVQLINAANSESTRNAKDVGVKITFLESQFRSMTDWFACTGQGLRQNGEFEAIADWVEKKFPHYYDLEPIMKDRPNTRPLLTHANNAGWDSSGSDSDPHHDGDNEDDSDDDSSRRTNSTLSSLNNGGLNEAVSGRNVTGGDIRDTRSHDEDKTPKSSGNRGLGSKKPSESVRSTASKQVPKRLKLVGALGGRPPPKRPRRVAEDDVLAGILGDEEGGSFLSLKKQELEMKRSTADTDLEIKRDMAKHQEVTARAQEVTAIAQAKKLEAETAKINSETAGAIKKRDFDHNFNLLKSRRALLESGVPVEEIELLFPLPKSDTQP
jgi:hypothetical protein